MTQNPTTSAGFAGNGTANRKAGSGMPPKAFDKARDFPLDRRVKRGKG